MCDGDSGIVRDIYHTQGSVRAVERSANAFATSCPASRACHPPDGLEDGLSVENSKAGVTQWIAEDEGKVGLP